FHHPPTSPPFPYTTLFRSRLRAALTPLAAGCFGLGPCSYHLYCPAALGLASFASDAPDATGTRRVWPREGNVLRGGNRRRGRARSEEHTSELQSRVELVCR